MRYNRISADCHLDLIWLPPDLFVSEAPQALKERMPYVADGPDGPRWVAKNGATFGLAGTYVLRLSASDSSSVGTDDVVVQVNAAPVVSAGPDRVTTVPTLSTSLDGTVSDDGLPNPPATVTHSWTKISGPGTVTFGTPTTVDTSVSVSQAGVYVLRLTSNDGTVSASDDVSVTIKVRVIGVPA